MDTSLQYGSLSSKHIEKTLAGVEAYVTAQNGEKNEQHINDLYTLSFVPFSEIISSIPFFKHSTASPPSKTSPSVMYLLKPLLGSISMAFLRHWHFFS